MEILFYTSITLIGIHFLLGIFNLNPIVMIKTYIKELLFGRPIKGEPINLDNKPLYHTIMPVENVSFSEWCSGKCYNYINAFEII